MQFLLARTNFYWASLSKCFSHRLSTERVYKIVRSFLINTQTFIHKGNNKITERRAIFQRERQNYPPFLWKCMYQVRAIAVFPVFRLLTDFVCLLTCEFCLSLWKIARCSVILLLLSLLVILSFFFAWPLYCLSFSDLVSSNCSH
jgi:hypothetical protein